MSMSSWDSTPRPSRCGWLPLLDAERSHTWQVYDKGPQGAGVAQVPPFSGGLWAGLG